MTQSPDVTVIVPTHRRSQSLASLLDALARQDYPRERIDIIVVGDGTSEERMVVAAAQERTDMPDIRLLAPEDDPHGGRSASLKRNTGAAAAEGEILAFTDDDCLPAPGWISAAAGHFSEGSVGGVEGRTEPVPQQKETIHYRQTKHLGQPGGYASCNMFYRRSVFEEAGGFDLRLPYYKEDSDLGFTVLERYWHIRHEPTALVQHPVRDEAPWNVFAMAAKVVYDPLLYKKHPELYRKNIGSPLTYSERGYLIAAALAVSGAFSSWHFAAAGGILFSLLFLRHLVKNFWGTRFTLKEFAGTTLGILCSPYVKLFQLLRGNWRYKAFLWR